MLDEKGRKLSAQDLKGISDALEKMAIWRFRCTNTHAGTVVIEKGQHRYEVTYPQLLDLVKRGPVTIPAPHGSKTHRALVIEDAFVTSCGYRWESNLTSPTAKSVSCQSCREQMGDTPSEDLGSKLTNGILKIGDRISNALGGATKRPESVADVFKLLTAADRRLVKRLERDFWPLSFRAEQSMSADKWLLKAQWSAGDQQVYRSDDKALIDTMAELLNAAYAYEPEYRFVPMSMRPLLKAHEEYRKEEDREITVDIEYGGESISMYFDKQGAATTFAARFNLTYAPGSVQMSDALSETPKELKIPFVVQVTAAWQSMVKSIERTGYRFCFAHEYKESYYAWWDVIIPVDGWDHRAFDACVAAVHTYSTTLKRLEQDVASGIPLTKDEREAVTSAVLYLKEHYELMRDESWAIPHLHLDAATLQSVLDNKEKHPRDIWKSLEAAVQYLGDHFKIKKERGHLIAHLPRHIKLLEQLRDRYGDR